MNNPYLRQEIRRVLRAPFLYVAMLAGLATLLAGIWQDLLWALRDASYRPNCVDMYGKSVLFGMLPLLAPLFCALPYSASLSEDLQSGLARYLIVRGKRLAQYAWAKTAATFISGILSLGIPALLFAGICFALFGPYQPAVEQSVLDGGVFTPLLALGAAPFLLVQALLAGVFGGLWALVGAAVSAYMPNKYLALAAPFLVYFFLIYLMQHLSLRMLDPGELFLLSPSFQYAPNAPLLALFMLAVLPLVELVLLKLVLHLGLYRRYVDGKL